MGTLCWSSEIPIPTDGGVLDAQKSTHQNEHFKLYTTTVKYVLRHWSVFVGSVLSLYPIQHWKLRSGAGWRAPEISKHNENLEVYIIFDANGILYIEKKIIDFVCNMFVYCALSWTWWPPNWDNKMWMFVLMGVVRWHSRI